MARADEGMKPLNSFLTRDPPSPRTISPHPWDSIPGPEHSRVTTGFWLSNRDEEKAPKTHQLVPSPTNRYSWEPHCVRLQALGFQQQAKLPNSPPLRKQLSKRKADDQQAQRKNKPRCGSLSAGNSEKQKTPSRSHL